VGARTTPGTITAPTVTPTRVSSTVRALAGTSLSRYTRSQGWHVQAYQAPTRPPTPNATTTTTRNVSMAGSNIAGVLARRVQKVLAECTFGATG
jgi:hypothetical protein